MSFLESALPREPHRGLRREDDDPLFPRMVEDNNFAPSYPGAQDQSLANPIGTVDEYAMTGALKRVGSQETVADEKEAQPAKEAVGWRRIVRNFTPSWFAVNMGTGIVSILLHGLPYNAYWIRIISIGFFLLNVLLFMTFSLITILRYILYPEIWSAMIQHPAQSLFLGCFPMGFATIINMTVMVCCDWGSGWVYFAWVMWWVDVVLSMASCVTMPFIVMHRHKPALHATTAALLLPIVPAVVASASGSIVAEVIPDRSHAILTIVVSYILLGIGESFAFLVLAMYFHRLHVHSLPAREAIVSVFLPVGPLGQGGFAIQKLGTDLLNLLSSTEKFNGRESQSPLYLGQIFYATGILFGFVMWGIGLVWLAFAFITIGTMKRFPFNMGWWGFTFPLGVFATCTSMLATELDSRFLRVLTTILSLCVVLLWGVVGVRTLYLAMTGEIFTAPCLQSLPKTRGDGKKGKNGGVDRIMGKRFS
ncbi:hypothetical protein MKZ38_002033 [Zalerion maritima]|uniref:Sulfite efflux pump SSU1 n=1 Tax=Zalerion maritima TaxID=339359 RepID=A0AAD5WXC9_9PEZI|nr:hypothetical protein MKZ38_002033 [Zalerion maritima]